MNDTYQAVEVATPGQFRLVEKPILQPDADRVRLRVEACGVLSLRCRHGGWKLSGLTLPRVPGHEIVGRIEAIGPNVSKWTIGQRVGVRFLGGEDGQCQPCLRGDFVNCLQSGHPGHHHRWRIRRGDDR